MGMGCSLVHARRALMAKVPKELVASEDLHLNAIKMAIASFAQGDDKGDQPRGVSKIFLIILLWNVKKENNGNRVATKVGMVGSAIKLSQQIERMVDVMENRSTTSVMMKESQGSNIAEVMKAVSSLLGAWPGAIYGLFQEMEISEDERKFKQIDCIGAIDGVHVKASIPPEDQVRKALHTMQEYFYQRYEIML
ncbi:unnamed protein product [Prunus armeniaca]